MAGVPGEDACVYELYNKSAVNYMLIVPSELNHQQTAESANDRTRTCHTILTIHHDTLCELRARVNGGNDTDMAP